MICGAAGVGGGASGAKATTAAGQRRKPRRRTTSGSKADDNPVGPRNVNLPIFLCFMCQVMLVSFSLDQGGVQPGVDSLGTATTIATMGIGIVAQMRQILDCPCYTNSGWRARIVSTSVAIRDRSADWTLVM